MCGIAGYFNHVGLSEGELASVRNMTACIQHRGPDDHGIWHDNQTGIALGHQRLSIVDLSAAGHQPMISHDHRFVMVFNGEIYNHNLIRSELDAAGATSWRGHSDSETLLEAASRWGIEKTLQRCVGMFAIAIWDRQSRRLTLARDRLGEKPIYYGEISCGLAFASELKAFQQMPGWNPEIDRNSLTLMLRHSYVPAPYSIYKGVHKLQPGCLLEIEAGHKPIITRYWDARQVAAAAKSNPFSGTRDEAVDQLEQLLTGSLRGQMLADVPLGAFLSGGVDSSLVVATMQEMSSRAIQTFSIGFNVAGYNEADHAKRVAEHLNTDHTELYVSEREAQEVIPLLPAIYCEPFADPSQIPTYLVSRLARRNVTVSLSGDGGDELFSGYRRYAFAEKMWKTLSLLPTGARSLLAKFFTSYPPAAYEKMLNPAFGLLPKSKRPALIGDKIHKGASLLTADSVDEIYLWLASHWRNPENLVLGGIEPKTMLTGLEDAPDFGNAIERMMYIDLVSYLPDDILAKVDRAAMAVSLETRVPFLDHRLVEFALSLPISISRADGVSKWPLRQLLYKKVPRNLIDRPKMGFGVPIDKWLRGPLRKWAENLLDPARLRNEGYFNTAAVRQVWAEHLEGNRNNQYRIWNVLMFQSWLESQSRIA